MGLDPLSAIAPARVKVLILPFGRIRQSRYQSFVARLQQENVVRLGDVSPDGRPHRTMFSPLAFPTGSVLYDISTSLPPLSHLALSPFELYREPLVAVAVSDRLDLTSGADLGLEQTFGADGRQHVNPTPDDNLAEMLSGGLEKLQLDYPRAIVHQILLFDCEKLSSRLPHGVIAVPSPAKSTTTTIKTLMCDLTSSLLAELTTFAKSLQALHTLESPKQMRGLTVQTSLTTGALPPFSTGQSTRSSSPKDSTVSRRPLAIQRSATNKSISETRDSSVNPGSGGVRTPPTTFDDIAGASGVSSSSRSSSDALKRPGSQDRVSIHGFGAGGIGERERNKGKGRVGVVIGSLYLLAGRWPDAIRELTESATVARTNSDHLWHAKALDYIMVCLLMYAWAGMDFRIPQILFPGIERPTSSSSKNSSHTPSNSLPSLASAAATGVSNQKASLEKLTDLLPDLINNILNLYARAWTFTEDKLPQFAFSETTIRFTKLLALISLAGGVLDDGILCSIVLNVGDNRCRSLPLRPGSFPTKAELVALLFRAFPGPSTSSIVPIEDRTMILAAIASVLSDLGFHRKKALVLKELLSSLIPHLVQARKEGAAEMGLHPAASLATLNASERVANSLANAVTHDEQESGLHSLLELVCHVYGISTFDPKGKISDRRLEHDLPDAVISRVTYQAGLRSFGNQRLKLDVLRSCISLCEALPDLGGVLRFSAEMLRTAGSGIAPGPESSGGSPTLEIEDQVRLANNISRTVSVARQLGKQNLEAEYWDEFLVRVIEHVEANAARIPTPHAKDELESVNSIDTLERKNTFIYNPFKRSVSLKLPRAVLVAQEEAIFRVTLQNLYDLDVEIERISLESSGLPFDCAHQATVLGPYGTHALLLTGVPRESGSLNITGCKVKVRGCRERSFPIFNKPWTPNPDIKIRRSEYNIKPADRVLPALNASCTNVLQGKNAGNMQGPTISSLPLKVIKAQPSIILKSISLPQSAVMLLEGETMLFTINVQNTSHVEIDMLFLSFHNSTTTPPRPSSIEKELSPAETYELEYSSIYKQPFRWRRRKDNPNIVIEPGEEASLEIEALGKPGLTFGCIQVDYGHLGDASEEIADHFYTRQLIIPLHITVNASVELIRNDLLHFTNDFAWQNKRRLQQPIPSTVKSPQSHRNPSSPPTTSRPQNRFQTLLGRIGLNPQDESHCLLLIDLRNSWPSPITISIQVRSLPPKNNSPTDSWKRAYTVHEPIQPGHTSRILLLLPRIYIPNPYAPIPSLAPTAKKRQFILSTAPKPAPEAELAAREAFHYREALLNHVRATWEEGSTGRTGAINLRALHLTTRMVSALKLDDLAIVLSVHPASLPSASDDSPAAIRQLSSSKYLVPTSTFLTLRTTLTNRSPRPIHPLLRLQPALANQPHNIALDLSRKLLWNGVLQRALAVLPPGESRSVGMGVVVLCEGVFEVGALVEEVRVLERAVEEREVLGDGGGERRVWHAGEACVLVGTDAVGLGWEGNRDEDNDETG